MIQLYFNGDSFVAGVELGDNILPDYPGLVPWHHYFTKVTPVHTAAKQWLVNTYDGKHALNRERVSNSATLHNLEFARAFPHKVKTATGYPVTNHSLGGASMDRIARVSLIDLYKLRQEHPADRIVAFIGTTHPGRSEIVSDKIGNTDDHGMHQDWICISGLYPMTSVGDYATDMIKYKVLYEKNYHSLVNFYRNVILVNDFCAVNNIDLHWVATNDNIVKDSVIEPELADRDSLVILRDYANLRYSIDMKDFLDKANTENVVCPGGHFGEIIHDLVAAEIVRLIK